MPMKATQHVDPRIAYDCWETTNINQYIRSSWNSTEKCAYLHLLMPAISKEEDLTEPQVARILARGVYDGAYLIYGASIWIASDKERRKVRGLQRFTAEDLLHRARYFQERIERGEESMLTGKPAHLWQVEEGWY